MAFNLGALVQQAQAQNDANFGTRSWYPEFQQVAATNNWQLVSKWAQERAPQFADWDPAAGDMVGQRVASMQSSGDNNGIGGWNKDDVVKTIGAAIAAVTGGGIASELGAAGTAGTGTAAGTGTTGGAGNILLANAGNTVTDVTPGLVGGSPAALDLGGGLTVDEFGNVTGANALSSSGSGDFFNPSTFADTPSGAFDMSGSEGVFDSSGNPLYTGPSALDYAKNADWANLAKQYGPGAISLLKSLARGIPGVAGAVAANNQSKDLADLAREYMALGAPSRDRYESSFSPGFTMSSDPGFTDSLNQSAKATLHGLSVGGNPADSPNAWAKSLQDLYEKNAYPALQDYRRVNAGAGGLAALTSAAPGAATGAINANANVAGALGGAAADIFTPKQSLADLLKSMRVSP